MNRAKGFAVITDQFGQNREAETFSCAHCNRIVMVPHMCRPTDAGGMCGVCASMICPACVNLGRCDPLEEKLQREEASYHARRSYGV